MGELSIKVTIANRVYPLSIEPDEEEYVRKAASMINDVAKNYEQNYAVKDKQDLLAMAALKFATEKLELDNRGVVQSDDTAEQLNALNQLLDEGLAKE